MIDKEVIFFGSTEAGIFAQALFPLRMEKTSAAVLDSWETAPAIKSFIRTITADDRKKNAYVLVNALGAGEFFGPNINADYFPWDSLAHQGDDFGYKTFYNAHCYTHHANKDPARAIGKPVVSVLNSGMKRVELIIQLDREKARAQGADGIITRVDNGEFPDVSMGCFTDSELVTMADGTRKKISEVVVGDLVLTHKGRSRRVTAAHRRQYKGELYTLRPEAHDPIRCTRQHPFLSVGEQQVKTKDYHANLRWNDAISGAPDWAHAECLDTDAYLLEPVFSETNDDEPTERMRALSRLLGYYLAEGHLLKDEKDGHLCGIELTTHKDDPIHAEIDHLCTVVGTRNTPKTFLRQNSEESRGIYVFDKPLAEFCRQHAGEYSLKKKLSPHVLGWPPALLKDLVGAYANGDGCAPADGSLRLSTGSDDLAHQWLVILPKLGIIPSHSVLHHKAGCGYSRTDTFEHVIHIGKQQAPFFSDVCAKVKVVEVLKSKNSRKLMDGYVVTPIREIDSMYVETEVFNLEVEEDESYLIEGLAVHNCKVPYDICSICGHRSKTRNDYCQHMRPPEELRSVYGPNKILPDGRKIYVINTIPRFFDISFVFIGADKTAKVMAKLATRGSHVCLGEVCALPAGDREESAAELYSATGDRLELSSLRKVASGAGEERRGPCGRCCSSCVEREPCEATKLAEAFHVKAAARKLAEIIKDVPTGVFATKRLPRLEESEPDISTEDLDAMAARPLPSALGAAARMGIVLKPHEFQRIVLKRMGEDALISHLDRHHHIFRELPESGSGPECDLRDPLDGIFDLLKKYIRARTALGPSFQMRVMIVGQGAKNVLPTRSPIGNSLLDKVSAAYSSYRRNVLEKMSQVVEEVQSDPRLAEAVIGDGLSMMFKTASSGIISTDTVKYMLGAHLQDRGLLCKSVAGAAVLDDSVFSETYSA